MGTKFLSEEKKHLLQKVNSLYLNRDINENIEPGSDLKTIKGTLEIVFSLEFCEKNCLLGF